LVWNGQDLFSWKYPQFLRSESMLESQAREHMLSSMQELNYVQIGEVATETSKLRRDPSWGSDGWTTSQEANLFVRFRGEVPDIQEKVLALELSVTTFFTQSIDVSINGHLVGTIESGKGFQNESYSFVFPRLILEENLYGEYAEDLVTISFDIDKPLRPADIIGNNDVRTLGLAVEELSFQAQAEN